ncbi:MAG: FAD-dependent monooxygenase [Pseudolabrys sp.]|nr:FAD-dependent monooxygenase [Pseudolabrys sp.]
MIFDALVIGGGPAGATAALLLARAGWSVALVEKKEFPRRKVCGEFISATSLTLLRELGVLPQFAAQAGPPVRQVGFFAGKHSFTAQMPSVDGELTWGRALGRETLDTLLLAQAARAGARIIQPATVRSIARTGDTHVACVEAADSEHDVRARVVIAAHGSWENGSLLTQASRPHRKSDLLAFKAHFTGGALPDNLMPLLAFPGGYGGMVHGDRGRVSLSCCIRRDALEAARKSYGGPAAEAVLAHIRNTCAGADAAMDGARREEVWLAAGPIRPGIRERYRDGIFVTGNAAGEAHPVVAEGISMAMQSSWLLCRALLSYDVRISSEERAAAAADYTADWSGAFAVRLYAAALFAQLAQRPATAELSAAVIARFPPLLTFGARLSGKTHVVIKPRQHAA